jgi:hypothetical protein
MMTDCSSLLLQDVVRTTGAPKVLLLELWDIISNSCRSSSSSKNATRPTTKPPKKKRRRRRRHIQGKFQLTLPVITELSEGTRGSYYM